MRTLNLALALALAFVTPRVEAADDQSGVFQFKQVHRNVDRDVDGIWGADAFQDPDKRPASIFEYHLKAGQSEFLISQIWNYECTNSDCPTRLIRIAPDGKKTVVIDDMMHQIIPPDGPDFPKILTSSVTKDYARAPFKLIDNGKRLANGGYTFDVGPN